MNKNIQFNDYLYNRLPEVYRREDSKIGVDFALKRYLEAVDEGGIQTLFGELLSLYDILEVETCPSNVLPLLSKMFGYNYIEEVDEATQRKIIANLIELYKRKGTKSVINFITREFTQFDTTIIELQYRIFKTWSPNPKGIPNSVYLEPRTMGKKVTDDTFFIHSRSGMYNDRGVIIICDALSSQVELLNRLLREFLPVYCNIYLRIRDNSNTFIESATVNGTDVSTGVKIKEVEQSIRTQVKDSIRVTYNTATEQAIATSDLSKVKVKQSMLDNNKIDIEDGDKHNSNMDTSDLEDIKLVVAESNNIKVTHNILDNDITLNVKDNPYTTDEEKLT